MNAVLESLRKDVVVGDGGWGTRLFEAGLEPGDCPERYGMDHPGLLTEIACGYLEAGADFLTTNTFGASPLKLRAYGLEDATEEINRHGVAVLREAAGGRAWVNGSIGPSGAILKPYGDTDEGEMLASFDRQARALAAAGVDLFCIETMIDLREAVLALQAVRAVAPDTPVLATMTFEATARGYFTMMGTPVREAADGLLRAGADAVGSNCGHGVEPMIEIAREFRRQTESPIVIQANAGLPIVRDGKTVYPETPAFLAARLDALLAAGAGVIGGCCGTTPAHVRVVRQFVDSHRRSG